MTSPTGPVPSLASLLAAVGVRSRAHADRDVSSAPEARSAPPLRLLAAEAASPLEALRLVAAAPRLAAVPRSNGHVVVDIPGWRAPESTGLPLRRYLSWLGYDARGWGFGTNLGDPRRDAERLTATVVRLARETGAPVSLVGWSLGGVIAREVARRRPDVLRRVVTYGTPVVGGPAYTAVAGAYSQEVRRDLSRVTARLDAERPVTVPVTAVYSRRDGIVAWQACLDRVSPRVEHVEVRSTHLGLGLDPDVWAVVAERLAEPTGPRRR